MQANEHFYGASGTFCALWLGITATAQADLRDPNLLAQLTPLEQRAALANQAVYDRLTIDPDGAGPQTAPCALSADPSTSLCANPALQNVFENVRELVHNANQLTGGGPTTFSLGFDVPNLGFALRWTAAEELAAQGASATEFSNNQLSALASRLSALRFGAGGLRVANLSTGDSVLLADNDSSRRGGGRGVGRDRIVAAAGGVTVVAHPWGRGSRSVLDAEALAGLKDLGLAGIEVDHQDHAPAARVELRAIARELDLVVTGSSDHHGLGKVDHDLGVNTTDPEQYERLMSLASRRLDG